MKTFIGAEELNHSLLGESEWRQTFSLSLVGASCALEAVEITRAERVFYQAQCQRLWSGYDTENQRVEKL